MSARDDRCPISTTELDTSPGEASPDTGLDDPWDPIIDTVQKSTSHKVKRHDKFLSNFIIIFHKNINECINGKVHEK